MIKITQDINGETIEAEGETMAQAQRALKKLATAVDKRFKADDALRQRAWSKAHEAVAFLAEYLDARDRGDRRGWVFSWEADGVRDENLARKVRSIDFDRYTLLLYPVCNGGPGLPAKFPLFNQRPIASLETAAGQDVALKLAPIVGDAEPVWVTVGEFEGRTACHTVPGILARLLDHWLECAVAAKDKVAPAAPERIVVTHDPHGIFGQPHQHGVPCEKIPLPGLSEAAREIQEGADWPAIQAEIGKEG